MSRDPALERFDERRQLRTRLMEWIFNEADGSEQTLIQTSNFHSKQGWDPELDEDLKDAIRYLEGERLIKAHWRIGGLPSVQLQHWGIKEFEQAMRSPHQPTEHFVPIATINNIYVGRDMIGSQIQQGSHGSTLSGNPSVDEQAEVDAFIKAVHAAINSLEFASAFREHAAANLAALETEVSKPTTNWKLVRTLGMSLKTIVESGLGGVLATAWTMGQ